MNVKICGLLRERDAALALDLGANFVGCVVAPDSPRSASFADRRAIRELARGRAKFVLVVRGLGRDAVRALAQECEPDHVQWHGLSPARERELAAELPLLAVREIGPGAAALPHADATPSAPVLLDGGRGGAGRRFDWSLLAGGAPACTFVAGGITPATLPALLLHSPWGIDVSSGIECAPGEKDPAALRALFECLEGVR
ncbi:MAG: phosphoribosylanthranilate isomerase [Planctomycetes bacterium]|nr:phosphoribosylanthranilate isomerase [Planctomycetota bacterium]